MARAKLADEAVDEVDAECRDPHPEYTYYPIVVCAISGQRGESDCLPPWQDIREKGATLQERLHPCRVRANGLANGAALRLRGGENELAWFAM